MNRTLAGVAKRTLLSARHYHRRLAAHAVPGVVVLCYHGVRPDALPARAMPFKALHVRESELEAHCRLIRETCQPISLQTWRDAVAGTASLPSRPILFTFDDGYRTVMTLARPILERYGIPAVFFVCTGPVRRRALTWYDAVARRCGEREAERLKHVPFREWKFITDELVTPVRADDPAALLTASEIRLLAHRPDFEIGAHTVDHPILAAADVEDQRRQIMDSKAELERWTGRPVKAFAYPNGDVRDYTTDTVRIVEEAGFDVAFTTRPRLATAAEPALERSRYVMLTGVTAAELAHRLSYSWRHGWSVAV